MARLPRVAHGLALELTRGLSLIAIDLLEGHLVVKAPFELKEACKAILGSRWSKRLTRWTYPGTPHSARNLEQGLLRFHPIWGPEAIELLKEYDQVKSAGAHKTAEEAELEPIPFTLRKPWLHQLRGYHFAKKLDAVMLALEMRCGKTKLAIDFLQNEYWDRTLVVCPPKVVQVWPAELEKHCGIPVHCVALDDEVGTIADRAAALKAGLALAKILEKPFVAVVNYEAIWRDPLAGLLLEIQWSAIVADEIHRIKTAGGVTSKYMARLAEQGNKRVGLTGTPLPHSRLDAFGQYRFLDRGIFGNSFTTFRARYAEMGGYNNHEIKAWKNEDEFYERLHSIMYRVKANDVQDLPPVSRYAAVQALPEGRVAL